MPQTSRAIAITATSGKIAERDVYKFKKGEYHIVVTGIIFNTKREILISKRARWKKYGGLWECNSGSILAGETSLEGIIRELKEELGIAFTEKDAIFLKEVKRNKKVPDFKDLWIFQKNIPINEMINIIDKTKVLYEKEIQLLCVPPAVELSSPAYTVRFTSGDMKGMTPAEVLFQNPENSAKLNELSEKQSKVQAELDTLYAAWEQWSEVLTTDFS